MEMQFEKLSKWNKYDKIAMNPPFGHSGKLAADHLEKALFDHISTGYQFKAFSRLIAIIPDGPGMQKRLEQISENKKSGQFVISNEILLPPCTFNRAGTSVICKVIVIDAKKSDMGRFQYCNFLNEDGKRVIDLRHCENINEFFKEIEHIQITDYNG